MPEATSGHLTMPNTEDGWLVAHQKLNSDGIKLNFILSIILVRSDAQTFVWMTICGEGTVYQDVHYITNVPLYPLQRRPLWTDLYAPNLSKFDMSFAISRLSNANIKPS